MSNRAAAQRILAQTVKSLEGLETPVLHRMLPILEKAKQEVERDLRQWLTGHHGADTFTAQRYRNAIAILNRAIAKGGDLAGVTATVLKVESKRRIGPLSVTNIQREWMEFGRLFEGTIQPLAIDQAIIIARGDKLLWKKFESSARRYAGNVGERVQRQLAVSMARSETMQEATNRLYKHFPSIWDKERSDAERLAVTECHNSYRQYHHEAIREAAKEDDKLMERWEGSADGRRCIICARLDGQVVEPGKPFRTIDGILIYEGEGAHPRCRCGRVPWRETWPIFANHTSVATIERAEQLAA